MKKRVLIAVLAAVMLTICACGSDYSGSAPAMAPEPAMAEAKESAAGYAMSTEAYDAAYDNDIMEEPALEEGMDSGGTRPYNGEVKLIYRADLSAQTTDLDKTAQEVEKLTKELGGYVESSDRSNYSYNSYSSKYAYYTIRVPQEKYETFLETLSNSGMCTVTDLSKSTTDVGAEYADTEARLKTYRIKQERLQTLLEQAENMEDIIAIENALTDVEYEIEYYSSSLNRYDALINFSTITIRLEQVERESRTPGSGSLGERIASSFSNGIAAFATGFEDFLVMIAGAIIPILILAAVVAVVVILIVRAGKKHSGTKREKKKRGKAGKADPEQNSDGNEIP